MECPTRVGRGRGLTLILLAALSPSIPAAQPDDPEPALSRAIDEALSAGSDDDATVRSLVDLGTEALPVLFDVAAHGRLPSPRASGDGEGELLDRGRQRLARRALGGFSWPAVQGLLRTVADRPADGAERQLGMDLVGERGSSRDLVLLAELAAPPRGERIAARHSQVFFRRNLRRLLERDPRGLRWMREVFEAAHPSFFAPMIETVRETGERDGLLLLAELLGQEASLDPLLLVEMGKLASVVAPPYQDAVRLHVRPHLRSRDTRTLLAAIHAIGVLEDMPSTATLVGLLDGGRANVAQAARRALEGLAGTDLGRDPETWADWHRSQMRWWEQDSRAELDTIAQGSPAEAAELLVELSRRRLFRHQIAPALAEGLRREERDLVLLTCAALGHLGSREAVPALTELLSSDDPDLLRAVFKALTKIVGRHLGPDPEPWLAWALEDRAN